MADYEITSKSTVTFHELYRDKEEDGLIMVGRQDIGSYVSLPVEALEVIDLLNSGKTVGEVKKFTEEKYGEDIGIDEFIKDMITNEMVHSVDGFEIPTTSQLQKDMFSSITQNHVQWLFSTYAWVIYAGIAVACILIFAVVPDYIPDPDDYFFHPWFSVAIVFWLFFGWVLLAYHEIGHLFAAKAVGTQGYFSLSNRLVFIVAQTNLGNIWAVPREKRYIVYLGGMAWDSISIFVCLLLLLLSDHHIFVLSPLWYAFLKSVIFCQVWGVIWQFRFNMQTDIYYVMANYFKCRSLLNDAQSYIKNFLSRFVKSIEKTDFANTPKSEMRAVKWYTPLYFVGTSVVLATFFLRSIPIFLLQVFRALEGFTLGYVASPELFIDAFVIIVVGTFNVELLIYLMLRPRWNQYEKRWNAFKQNFRAVFTSG